jgi:hypothetical protein
MKNIKNLSFILIAFLTIAICSCNHGTTATFTGGNQKPLTISITSNENIKLFDTSASQRTIVADAFTTGSGLTFYLWGTAQSGQTLAPKTVTVTPDKIQGTDNDDPYNGKVILDIDCYNWELTLAACKTTGLTTEADILADAVLIGYGNVDMMFTNNIKFTLSPKGLSKTGTVDLDIVLAEGMSIPSGYDVKAYIYDMTTGKEVKASDGTSALSQVFTSFPANFTANSKDINPGTYLFQVEFTKDGENRKYVYNDTLIILPGSETEKKTADSKEIIIPNLLGKKPKVPSHLNVTFNQDANDKEESKYSGYYPVTLTWTDESNNETNFALQIAEVADSYTPAAVVNDKTSFEAIWDTAANNNAKYEFNYLNDIRANTRFYKNGSLFANNHELQLYLELGKRYVVRLYSENNAGYSVDDPTAANPVETAAYATITALEKDNSNNDAVLNTINRYRVKYWNQGGIWNTGENLGAENGTEGYNLPRIQYWSMSNVSCPILNPVAGNDGKGTTAAPYLYRSPAKWLYWVTSLSTSAKYPDANSNPYAPDPYSGYKNLDLFAVYSREGQIEIWNDVDYDLKADYISGFGKTAGGLPKATTTVISKTATGVEQVYSVDAEDDNIAAENKRKCMNLSVTLPQTKADQPDTWVYDTVTLEITYSGYTYFVETQTGAARGLKDDSQSIDTASESNTFEVLLGQLPTGYTYLCKVTAQYQLTTVSYTFAIELNN